MFQLTALYNQPEDPAAFDRHYDNVHAALAMKLPGLQRFAINRPGPDPDGNPLSAVLGSGPSHGTLTLDADGSFIYTPAANFNGSDSFTYKANDGSIDSNVATVTITVTGTNDAAVLSAATFKAARTVASDEILSFVREPFARARPRLPLRRSGYQTAHEWPGSTALSPQRR